MTDKRWRFLMNSNVPIAPEEAALGWHWCNEFDGLLVGPGMSELQFCCCEFDTPEAQAALVEARAAAVAKGGAK